MVEYSEFLNEPFLKEISLRKLTIKHLINKEIFKIICKISKRFVEDLNLNENNNHSK